MTRGIGQSTADMTTPHLMALFFSHHKFVESIKEQFCSNLQHSGRQDAEQTSVSEEINLFVCLRFSFNVW